MRFTEAATAIMGRPANRQIIHWSKLMGAVPNRLQDLRKLLGKTLRVVLLENFHPHIQPTIVSPKIIDKLRITENNLQNHRNHHPRQHNTIEEA